MRAAAGFSGFRPAAFAFLRGLRDNNDPVWFKPRKAVYEAEVLAPFRSLIAAVGDALAGAGVPLKGNPAHSVFRIYRDVRFSADKRLYKTHAGAVLTRSGDKRDPGLLYLHVEPSESMAAAGFWRPEPVLLMRLRHAILDDPNAFRALVEHFDATGYPLASDAMLSRLPRGFEALQGSPVADYVRWKSFTVRLRLSDDEMLSPAAVSRIVEFALAARRLLEWGWSAADEEIPPPLTLRMPTRPLPQPDF